MPTRTESIKAFLEARAHKDLASLYHHDMECQVIVAQGTGERIDGEFAGTRWQGYTDGIQTWKPFRIPRNASTEPEYIDVPMTFDLGLHCEAIGMTGWNWNRRVSQWVAFDFDAILGHDEKHTRKLTSTELEHVRTVACQLEWVTVRRSTSGKGLHLYVLLDDVSTQNHTEHAALARSILAKMGSLTGYDFQSKVDICGGNMWIWHRKMMPTLNTEQVGLQILKQGIALRDIPPNWKDHLNVVKGVSKKLQTPTDISELQDTEDKFDVLCGQRTRVALDTDHIRLITYLNQNGLYHWWDADRHMLVTHTANLKQAHTELGLKGIFETETKATTTHNCFLYPIRRGAWSVRRFTPGVKEHASWDCDGSGWTRCYFNQEPSLRSASLACNALEDPSGAFHFKTGDDVSRAAIALGANVHIPPKYNHRTMILKLHKDGVRLVIEFNSEQGDNPSELDNWLQKGNKWIKIFSAQRNNTIDVDTENYDDLVRHLVTEGDEDSGWVVHSDGKWNDEPISHVRAALQSMNLKKPEIDSIIGSSVLKPWILVNFPFQPIYPGNRIWNRKSPQLRFVPTIGDSLYYPTWMKVLKHIGQSLDEPLKSNTWAKQNGIITGSDYLKTWISSMIQNPSEPLPYLFIYGETQETGKSTLHEALELLFNPGYVRVDHALQNGSSFNGELLGAILCVVEETNLHRDQRAYNRIKDWVTSPKLSIHCKNQTPYMIDNTTHFIHCANERTACPIFPGDTRITMIQVSTKPEETIPKRLLLKQLEKEAQDFLGAIVHLEIPESDSRLRVPVIETSDKIVAQQSQRTSLQEFIDEVCHRAPGYTVTLAEFYERFLSWLEPHERPHWHSKQKVSAHMPDWVIKGRLTNNPSWHWGNISFDPPKEERPPFIVANERLVNAKI